MTITHDEARNIVKATLETVGSLMAMIPGVDPDPFTTDELIDQLLSEWMDSADFKGVDACD